jgi:hypothetical protein
VYERRRKKVLEAEDRIGAANGAGRELWLRAFAACRATVDLNIVYVRDMWLEDCTWPDVVSRGKGWEREERGRANKGKKV